MAEPNIVPRAAWGARPPRSRVGIDTPTPELWLHHTAGNEQGPTGMRAIQATHMDRRDWADIGYSFVIDRDGTVYEGRGAGIGGAHTEGHNTRSHGICVMGNYETSTPSRELLTRIAELVAHGHRRRWWPDHLTGGHRDTKATACPGARLYALIPTINSLTKAILQGAPMPTPGAARQVEDALRAIGWTDIPADDTPDDEMLGAAAYAITALAGERDALKATVADLEAALAEARRATPTVGDREYEAIGRQYAAAMAAALRKEGLVP